MQPISLRQLQRILRRRIDYKAAILSPAIMAIRPQQTNTIAQASSAGASAVVAHWQTPVAPYFPLFAAVSNPHGRAKVPQAENLRLQVQQPCLAFIIPRPKPDDLAQKKLSFALYLT